MIQASWNYERQMNMGYMYGMSSILDKIYSKPEDIEKKKEAYNRHLEFSQLYATNGIFHNGPDCFDGGAIL